MWATVLVVYFIKFVYTVRMEGNYFWLVTPSEAVMFLCERGALMSTRCLMCVNDKKALATLQARQLKLSTVNQHMLSSSSLDPS